MRPDNLGFLTIPEPAVPQDQNDLIELSKWKAMNKCYSDLMEKQEENKQRAYAIVWGQCSPTIQEWVRASTNYATINNILDLIIELLGVIRKSMYTGATSKAPRTAYTPWLIQWSIFIPLNRPAEWTTPLTNEGFRVTSKQSIILDFPKPRVTRVGHDLGVVPVLSTNMTAVTTGARFSMDICGGLDIHGGLDPIRMQTASSKCS
jgi:hypothetical protein